jgi:hypothetical protein
MSKKIDNNRTDTESIIYIIIHYIIYYRTLIYIDINTHYNIHHIYKLIYYICVLMRERDKSDQGIAYNSIQKFALETKSSAKCGVL